MMRIAFTLSCLVLAGCATGIATGPGAADDPRAPGAAKLESDLLHSSAECVARKLKPGEPFPAGAIPQEALNRRQSGSVAIRYDVVDGVARNLVVVASNPAGLYDSAALDHAARYRDPARNTVRGCVMTIDVKF